MSNRLSNALRTLLQPGWDAELRRDRQTVRELIAEMEDVLEKFSRVVARQGMRRSRAMKRAMKEREMAPPPPPPAAPPVDDVAARKAELRRRVGLRARGADVAAGE